MLPKPIRLNKYLAETANLSRRSADAAIAGGRVAVNSLIAELGQLVDPSRDHVEIDGQPVGLQPENYIYYALNKPAGFVVSAKPTADAPRIVFELIPAEPRVFPVGRLDKDTTGLLILTNDGNLAADLMNPLSASEKEYEVTLAAPLTPARVEKLEAGMLLEGRRTRPTQVRILGRNGKKARIILTEGRNRQVRKIFAKVGCEVLELQRVRIKQLELDQLALEPGKWKILSPAEVKLLRDV